MVVPAPYLTFTIHRSMQYVYGALSPTHNQLARTSDPWRIVRSTSCSSALHAMSTLLGTSSIPTRCQDAPGPQCLPSIQVSASSTVRKMILLMWTPTHSWGNYNRLVMFIYAYFLTIYRWPTTNKTFLFPSSPVLCGRGARRRMTTTRPPAI